MSQPIASSFRSCPEPHGVRQAYYPGGDHRVPGLLLEPLDEGAVDLEVVPRERQVDPVDADPASCKRQRDPAGADGELQRGTATRQLLQERDGPSLLASARGL